MGANRTGARARLASIRARTTMAACVVVTAALLVGALLILSVLRRSLVANIDGAARTRAQDIAALAGQGSLPRTLAVPGEEIALVQVVDRTGSIVSSGANLEGQAPIATFKPSGMDAEIRTLRDLPVGDRAPFRVVALNVDGASGPVTVYVAASLAQTEASVDAVMGLLLFGLPVLLLLVGATSWVIVGRALRPVESIRKQVADISAHDLSRRVPAPTVDDEVGRLARTMNAMLDRLQTFGERQRRFLADASHELQSPLASSRSELEIATAHPDSTDWVATAADLLDDNVRMERLVRDLVFLARADDAPSTVVRAAVDLDDVIREEVQRARTRARVAIDASRVSAVEVRGNADQLARVIRNLLENADRHATAQVTIDLHSTDDGWAQVVVVDDGPGVAAPDRERIFERFTRLDSSRSRDTGGAGLGLAIAREVVEAHGGRIFAADADVGARFVVLIPTA
jgi:signal transduction histidine kinase